jgi:hypothetical protein
MPDPLRLTIAYLRLWKLCDSELSKTSKYDSARVFEVIPLDQRGLLKDLQSMAKTELDWADKPENLRLDIETVLELSTRPRKTEKELAAIDVLRRKFQEKALLYSGNIRIAASGGASAGT